MRKAIISLAVIVFFFFTASHAFSEEIVLKANEDGTWEMQSKMGEMIGTLKKEGDVYRFYDKNQGYLGSILESKDLMPRGFHSRFTKISPDLAQLYLDLLVALKTIK